MGRMIEGNLAGRSQAILRLDVQAILARTVTEI